MNTASKDRGILALRTAALVPRKPLLCYHNPAGGLVLKFLRRRIDGPGA
jgi:hypothetical protein